MLKHENPLAKEKSLYLQQHKDNPVYWYPWHEDTLLLAKKLNKPILLSIGYAACHWCHVMAHESFEDEATASLMNQYFINIKVDREERPDLDKIFQTAHYILSQQSGGWPLTLFLTPDDLTPFYSGTYFPRESRYQLPAFKDVLKKIAELYQKNLLEIKKQNVELSKILNAPPSNPQTSLLTREPITKALLELEKTYDATHGGFGRAPKFPQVPKLMFLLNERPDLAIETLTQMQARGIYDHLGGGFFRYSVDENWLIPHFEKMLYDNALLLQIYASAAKKYNRTDFKDTARAIADWLMKHMQNKAGGFFSSLDADTEAGEGKYYLWNREAIKTLLTVDEYQIIEKYFGLTLPPNHEGEWHLSIAMSAKEIAKQLNLPFEQVNHAIQSAKQKLLSAREKRPKPTTDTKILTATNALMIKALYLAFDALHDEKYLDAAERTLAFILRHLWVNDNLLAVFAEETAYQAAYLDDYAYLLDALLTSLQIKWHTPRLQLAMKLADQLLADFFDDEHFGFYFTRATQEKVLYRPKTMMDEAIPAGNAVIANAFLLLGYLVAEPKYLSVVEQTLKAIQPALMRFPAEHCIFLLALKNYLQPERLVIVRANDKWLSTWQKAYADTGNCFAIPLDAEHLPSGLKDKKPIGEACAYICEGFSCQPVVTKIDR